MIEDKGRLFFGDMSEKNALMCTLKMCAPKIWRRSNILVLITYLRVSLDKRLRLQYENFCSNLGSILEEVSKYIDLTDVSKVLKSVDHNSSGSLFRCEFKLGAINLDEQWKADYSDSEISDFEIVRRIFIRVCGHHI